MSIKKWFFLLGIGLLSCNRQLPHQQYVATAKAVTAAIDYTQPMIKTHLDAFDEMVEKIGDTTQRIASAEMLDIASGCETGAKTGLTAHINVLDRLQETDPDLKVEAAANNYVHTVDSILSSVLPYFTQLSKNGNGVAEKAHYQAIKQALTQSLEQGEKLNLLTSTYMQQHKVQSTEILEKQ